MELCSQCSSIIISQKESLSGFRSQLQGCFQSRPLIETCWVPCLWWEGSVEGCTTFILCGKEAVPTGKDAVTWMWLSGTGEVGSWAKERGPTVGAAAITWPFFGICIGLSFSTQKFHNNTRALQPLLKIKNHTRKYALERSWSTDVVFPRSLVSMCYNMRETKVPNWNHGGSRVWPLVLYFHGARWTILS